MTLVVKNFKTEISRRRNWIVFVGLILLVFWIYRDGLAAIPRGDHSTLMTDRYFSRSDWDFFLKTLSFNRTREIGKGDYYLFRPATTGLLGFIDIFWGRQYYVHGVLSVFSHALLAFLFYLLAKRFIRFRFSVLFAIYFCAQFPGMDMILWRHVSPYIFGIFFYATACYCLLKRLEEPKSLYLWLAGFSIFVSSLFHEAAALSMLWLSLAVFPCYVFFPRVFGTVRAFHLFLVFVLPLILYTAINGISFYIYRPHSLIIENVSSGQFSLGKILEALLFVLGYFTIGAFVPECVWIGPGSLWGRGTWNYGAYPIFVFQILGIIAAIFLIVVICSGLGTKAKMKSPEAFCLVMLLTGYLLALVVGLGIMRVNLRSPAYFYESTYYFYFGSFFLTLLFLVGTERLWSGPRFRLAGKLAGSLFIVHFLYNYFGVRAVLPRMEKEASFRAEVNGKLDLALRHQKNVCFGGVASSSYIPIYLTAFFRQSCFIKGGVPVYFRWNEKCDFELASMNSKIQWTKDPLHFLRKKSDAPEISFHQSNTFKKGDRKLGELKATTYVSHSVLLLNIAGDEKFAWVFRYRSPTEYFILFKDDFSVTLYHVEGGERRYVFDQFVGRPKILSLETKRIGDEHYIFSESMLLGPIGKIDAVTGFTAVYGQPQLISVPSLHVGAELHELTWSKTTDIGHMPRLNRTLSRCSES